MCLNHRARHVLFPAGPGCERYAVVPLGLWNVVGLPGSVFQLQSGVDRLADLIQVRIEQTGCVGRLRHEASHDRRLPSNAKSSERDPLMTIS